MLFLVLRLLFLLLAEGEGAPHRRLRLGPGAGGSQDYGGRLLETRPQRAMWGRGVGRGVSWRPHVYKSKDYFSIEIFG